MIPTVTTILVVLNWLRQSVDANLQVIDNTETFSVHCFPQTKGNINIDTISRFAHDNKLYYNRDHIVSCDSLLYRFVLNLMKAIINCLDAIIIINKKIA